MPAYQGKITVFALYLVMTLTNCLNITSICNPLHKKLTNTKIVTIVSIQWDIQLCWGFDSGLVSIYISETSAVFRQAVILSSDWSRQWRVYKENVLLKNVIESSLAYGILTESTCRLLM